MLWALLLNNQDVSAFKYTHLYINDANNIDLLKLCMKNTNEYYLEHALWESIFGGHLINSHSFIEEIISWFWIGSKLNLIMKVLCYLDFTKWTQHELKEFVEIAATIIKTPYDRNIIVNTQNPLLFIALLCENLKRIGNYTNFLRLDCINISSQLMNLAKTISDGVEDMHLESMYMDSDFKGRTLMKIISENEYSKLFETEWINLLLHEIW